MQTLGWAEHDLNISYVTYVTYDNISLKEAMDHGTLRGALAIKRTALQRGPKGNCRAKHHCYINTTIRSELHWFIVTVMRLDGSEGWCDMKSLLQQAHSLLHRMWISSFPWFVRGPCSHATWAQQWPHGLYTKCAGPSPLSPFAGWVVSLIINYNL